MIFVDTDVFVIEELFPEDKRHQVNKRFLGLEGEKSTSIYNLLELCGLASFTLNTTELTNLFTNFHRQHSLRILYSKILKPSPEEMIRNNVSRIFAVISAVLGLGELEDTNDREVTHGHPQTPTSHLDGFSSTNSILFPAILDM